MSGHAAIVGLGARGTRWAEALQAAGWMVSGFDPDDRAGRGLGGATFRRETTISGTVRRADVVLCFLPDRLELVRMVLQRVQAETKPDAMIAVHSRLHDVDEVQGCAMRPAQVVRLSDGAEGGVVLDVSARNDDALRERATLFVAGLAAVLSLAPVVATSPDLPASREA